MEKIVVRADRKEKRDSPNIVRPSWLRLEPMVNELIRGVERLIEWLLDWWQTRRNDGN